MISNERLREIINNADMWAGEHSSEFYECFIKALCLTEEEADELGIQLPVELPDEEEEEMKTIRYYVCGIGYDTNDCVTDYERYFGDFDTYEEAYHAFVTLQCTTPSMFFDGVKYDLSYIKLQLEECEETDEGAECIDVRNEWWIDNPNFKEETK